MLLLTALCVEKSRLLVLKNGQRRPSCMFLASLICQILRTAIAIMVIIEPDYLRSEDFLRRIIFLQILPRWFRLITHCLNLSLRH